MTRPLWFAHILKKVFKRIPSLTFLIKLPIIRTLAAKHIEFDKIYYITQDKIISVNKEISKADDMVMPSEVLKYFIKKASHRWIMNFCMCREGMDCKKHSHSLGCLFLGEGVLQINPDLGRLASEEEALAHLEKCREAGLIHIIGRQKIDAWWLNVKPEHKIMTICNCCDCCCITNILKMLPPQIRASAARMSGVEMIVGDDCTGCGLCTQETCVFNAIKIVNKRVVISDECRCCGRCVTKCPRKNITVKLNDDEYVQKSISDLEKLVRVT